jgi:hypothetical protein
VAVSYSTGNAVAPEGILDLLGLKWVVGVGALGDRKTKAS